MKKTILLFCLLFTVITVKAQEETTNSNLGNQKHHEVKLNGIMLLVGAFEGTYEYNLNEESSIGASIFLPISDEIDVKYFSPYYRVFFGKKYAAGFFIEGFGMLNNYGVETTYYNEFAEAVRVEEDNITDFALGLGLGGKWISRRNFVFELNAGFGRNLFNNDSDIDGSEFVGKFGFNIGYRF